MGILSRLAVKYVTGRRRHLGNIIDQLAGSLPLTRRDWLRGILGGVALYVTAPDSVDASDTAMHRPQCRGSIRAIFLGEELTCQIGFWLFANLGEARIHLVETGKPGKQFFVKFRIKSEDVSSKTGEVEGWMSQEGTPTKGVIKDVIFFGDLWGELVLSRLNERRKQ